MSVYDGKYTEKSVTDSSFKRKEEFLKPPRAAEGESSSRPKYPDYAGGRTGKTNVDPDLKYSGGNDGYQGGDK
jgi:hypothetical protein